MNEYVFMLSCPITSLFLLKFRYLIFVPKEESNSILAPLSTLAPGHMPSFLPLVLALAGGKEEEQILEGKDL